MGRGVRKKNRSRHGKGGIIAYYCAIFPSQTQTPFIAYNIAQYIFPTTPFIAIKYWQYLVWANDLHALGRQYAQLAERCKRRRLGVEQPQKRSIYERQGQHKRYDLSLIWDFGVCIKGKASSTKNFRCLHPKAFLQGGGVLPCGAGVNYPDASNVWNMGTPRPAARPQAIAFRRRLAPTPGFSSKL